MKSIKLSSLSHASLSGFNCNNFLRSLRGVRLSSELAAETNAVSDPGNPEVLQCCRFVIKLITAPGLPSQLHVRGHQLGQLPHQARGGAGQDGAPGHSVPRPHQYLQQCQVNKVVSYYIIAKGR